MQTLTHAHSDTHTQRKIVSLDCLTLLYVHQSAVLHAFQELVDEVLLNLIFYHFSLSLLPQLEMSYISR